MQLTYALTLKDYKAALQLHRRERIGRRIHFCLFSVAVPILVIIPLIALLKLILGEPGGALTYVFVPDFILLLIIYSFREKHLLHCPSLNQNLILCFDDEGIRSVNSDVSEGRTYWKGVCSIAQDDKVMLLYTTDKTIVLVPRRILSPNQQTELNDLVARHVVRKPK